MEFMVGSPFRTAGDEGHFWKRAGLETESREGASAAWRQALRAAISRSSSDPIPVLIGNPPPVGLLPSDLHAEYRVVVADAIELYSGLPASLSMAVEEFRALCCSAPSGFDVAAFPVSPLLPLDQGADPASAPLVLSLISRLAATWKQLILLAGEPDLARLAGCPLQVFRIGLPSCPSFLVRLEADDNPWAGREAEILRLERLVASHRHVVVTGPAGAGKTVLVRRAASLSAHPFFQIEAQALASGTVYRGSLEHRIRQADQYLRHFPGCAVLLDEVLSFTSRTGDETGTAHDSPMDFLKPLLSDPGLQYCIVGTATTEEFRRLTRRDVALARRLVELPLPPLTAREIDSVVGRWAKRFGLPSGRTTRRQVVTSAEQLWPRESSPARETKFLSLWASDLKRRRPQQVVTALLGPLAVPDLPRILENVHRALSTQVLGRPGQVAGVEAALRRAVRRRLAEGGRCGAGPLFVLLLVGPRGTSRRFVARTVADAVAPGRRTEIAAAQLGAFLQQPDRCGPGTLIVKSEEAIVLEGDGGHSTSNRLSYAEAIGRMSCLDNWAVILLHEVPGPLVSDGDLGTIVMNGLPVDVVGFGTSDLTVDERRQIAKQILDRTLASRGRWGLRSPSHPAGILEKAVRCSTPAEIESVVLEGVLPASAALSVAEVSPCQRRTTTNVVELFQSIQRTPPAPVPQGQE